MELIDRYRGSLLGLAAGDALGTTLEFSPPGTFQPIHDIVGGGPFQLPAGAWTDDTSMALCLAESLIERQGFDATDQLDRYVRWWRKGHLSSTGRCFDIGNTTCQALARFERTRQPDCGTTDPTAAGNGSIMRLAPVVLAYAGRPDEAIAMAAASSRTTHAAPEPVAACRYLAALLLRALAGEDKAAILAPTSVVDDELYAPGIRAVASGTYRHREPPKIRGTGYVVQSLEAALWAFHRSRSFDDGALLAVNLGDDADTTGAVYGQLAGAYYGVSAIPDAWKDKILQRRLIESMADQLLVLRDRLERA